MRLRIETKLFLSHFAAIILVSGSVGTYFYQSAIDNLSDSLRSRLQNSAALVSQGLEVRSLDRIRTADDAVSPEYLQGVKALRDFVSSNPDIAFIYVMRKQGDEAVFVLDSDPVDPALPGETYRHNVPALMEGFVRPSVDEAITHDRWGSFLSGYAPLSADEGNYLVGIDMFASEVASKLKQIRVAGILSLLLSVLLAMIFGRVFSRSLTRRIRYLTDRLSSVAAKRPVLPDIEQGDELQQLTDAFEGMYRRIEANRQLIETNQQALRKARDELELRVEERTAELLDANQQLHQEIAERKLMEQRLEELSRTDYLTGIFNRRALTRELEAVRDAVTSEAEAFCTILVDLDHFKQINDRYGHARGDQTLRFAVERLRHGLRERDLLGRWGGEEFLIIAPRTSLGEAQGLAERLRKNLADSRVSTDGSTVSVTASFGLTRFVSGEDLDACLKRTDDALYEAKRKGRDRIEVAASP